MPDEKETKPRSDAEIGRSVREYVELTDQLARLKETEKKIIERLNSVQRLLTVPTAMNSAGDVVYAGDKMLIRRGGGDRFEGNRDSVPTEAEIVDHIRAITKVDYRLRELSECPEIATVLGQRPRPRRSM